MINLNVKCDGGLMRPPTNDARWEPLISQQKKKKSNNKNVVSSVSDLNTCCYCIPIPGC